MTKVYVYSDSQGTGIASPEFPYVTWFDLLRDAGHNVLNNSQAGRKAADFFLPYDDKFGGQDYATHAIYLIGAEDVLVPERNAGMQAAMRLLRSREFTVTMMLYPHWAHTPEIDAKMNAVRLGQFFIGGWWGVNLYDMDTLFDVGQTWDSIHPNQTLAQIYATDIETALGL